MINLVNKRFWFFAISILTILPGLIALFVWGLRTGIDFAGGTRWEISFPGMQTIQPGMDAEINQIFAQRGFEEASTQLSEGTQGEPLVAVVRTQSPGNIEEVKAPIFTALRERFGAVEEGEFLSVGATVSAESTRAAVIAVLGASIVILFYLTMAFRKTAHAIRYGVCAIIAMLHDVLVVVGIAAILGQLIGLEVDALFLTALLTVISFSVHDTIVVFDRVRENLHRMPSSPYDEVVNHSLVQTLVRSLNTQVTTLVSLMALLLFIDSTKQLQHFLLIMTIGLISGTYSSLFNAAQLLVAWETGDFSGRKRATAAAA